VEGLAAKLLWVLPPERIEARRSSLLGLQLFERVNLDVLDKGEEFLAGLLVIVALPGNSNTHLPGDVPDASGPDHAV
jgi:hypothetical protein